MQSEDGLKMISTRREQALYLRELGPYILASVLLMTAGAIFGVVNTTYAPLFTVGTQKALGEFARLFLGLPKPYLALAIFLNNSLKTLAVIVIGALGGVLPLIFLLTNGYVLGMVLHVTIQSRGWSGFLLAIAPHGLFEIPAILLGTGIGLMLGVRSIERLFGKGERTLGSELTRGLRFFAAVIVPLLLLAALVEAFVTAALAAK